MNSSLPFELIKDIIQLSLPPARHSTYVQRYTTLSVCSLISKNWRNVAQEELMNHIVIKSREGLELLLERIQILREEGFNIAPVSLHLEGNAEADINDVDDLLQLCVTIKTLFIVGRLFPTDLFSSFDWSSEYSFILNL